MTTISSSHARDLETAANNADDLAAEFRTVRRNIVTDLAELTALAILYGRDSDALAIKRDANRVAAALADCEITGRNLGRYIEAQIP